LKQNKALNQPQSYWQRQCIASFWVQAARVGASAPVRRLDTKLAAVNEDEKATRGYRSARTRLGACWLINELQKGTATRIWDGSISSVQGGLDTYEYRHIQVTYFQTEIFYWTVSSVQHLRLDTFKSRQI
jgi:hypothetical protein